MINNIKKIKFFQITTIYLRYLLGATFIIASFGMGKFNTYNTVDLDMYPKNSYQYVFGYLKQFGFLYKLVGWTQLISGLLLVTQKYSKIALLIYTPILTTIFGITIYFNFGNTFIITSSMLFANIFLVVWDFSLPKTFDVKNTIYWVGSGVFLGLSFIIIGITDPKNVFLIMSTLFVELFSILILRLIFNKFTI